MKRILFVYTHEPNPTKGGIERVTSILMNKLQERGYECSFLLLKSGEFHRDCFIYENQKVKDLHEFLIKHRFDVIINQCYYSGFTQKYKSCKLSNIKYVTCYHDAPGSLLIGLKHRLANSKSFFRRCLTLIYPIYRCYSAYKNRIDLKINFMESDKFVLLSKRFADSLYTELGIKSSNKICAIANPLSFDLQPISKMEHKENIALVVARLEESQKRISESLYIWQMFCKTKYAIGWKLYILGEGSDRSKYENLASSLGISNSVVFTGRTNPVPYYEKAKTFFMTSSHEGWGLTLTECMQFGVIPIAYNTYASINDIIINGETGFLIPDKCRHLFLERLISLVSSTEDYHNMSSKCRKHVESFSQDKIMDNWELIINE